MRLYNTLTRQKENFEPMEPGKVRMYACGPTVYNYFHIGNARTFITFDALRQYLQYRGYAVTFVQNFTDVDDKIIQQSQEEEMTPEEISEKYIQAYFQDADSLGIQRADVHPRVTETIPEIIDFVETLITRGYAYELEGNVYFDVSAYSSYGKLTKQSLDELKSGARVEVNECKRNPLDFALWKASKPGEPWWDSPWGQGRPGWHIECSAMVRKYLGETIDIHGGGGDLTFPHHENEVAQSEALSGKPFARYWVHVGYLNIDNRKMSKSLNNFFTTREIAQEFDLEVVRFFILSAHYRNPINFSRESMQAAQNGLERLYTARNNWRYYMEQGSNGTNPTDDRLLEEIQDFREQFVRVMDDDFNTADGLAVIFDLVKRINAQLPHRPGPETIQSAYMCLCELAGVLGLLQKEKQTVAVDDAVEQLIEERQKARREKDYGRADEIRDELKKMGILLEDTPEGVRWKRV